MEREHCIVDTRGFKRTLIIFKFLLRLHCDNGYTNAPRCSVYTYVILSCLFLWQRIAGYGKGGYTLVTLPRTVTQYRDCVNMTRYRVTYQKLVTGNVTGLFGVLSVFGLPIRRMIRLRPEQVWTCNVTRHHRPLFSLFLQSVIYTNVRSRC